MNNNGYEKGKRFFRRKGFWGRLALPFLGVLLILCLSGCQSAAVREETLAQRSNVADPLPEIRTGETGIEEMETEASGGGNDEYVDAADIAGRYGETEENFDAYLGKSGQESGSGRSDVSSPANRNGDNQTDSGNQNPSDENTGMNGDERDSGWISGTGDDNWEGDQDEYKTDPVPDGMPEPVEPQDEVVDENTSYTCTLYVECSAIWDNIGDLTEGKEDLVPSDGVIYGPRTVTFYDGESVYDVLLREMQNSRIHMEASYTPAYNSAYVEGINNLYEKDCGSLSGWMYCVNGWYPNYGCSRYQLQDGDVVEWHYTCDLGRDLGRDMSE